MASPDQTPSKDAPLQPSPPPQEDEILRLVERYRAAVVEELSRSLERPEPAPYDLMRYHLGWQDREGRRVEGRGGKLLRPALCLLCCEAAGGEWQRAVPAAAALELLHNFTLIHDDIEDASLSRHGRETVWRIWGEALAINAGDGMYALAHATLLRLEKEGHPPERVLRSFEMFDAAALHLCEGQHRDLTSTDRDEIELDDYIAMVEGKTAALLAATAGIGALLGGSDEAVDAFREFGRRLGLAFQIRDDILGIWGDAEATGKPASDDLRSGKKTFPVLAALERASLEERRELLSLLSSGEMNEAQVDEARAIVEGLGGRQESERAALEQAEAAIGVLSGRSLEPDRARELELLSRFAARRDS